MAWKEIIYQYDGSFDGLLSCIYESYTQKERPTAIVGVGDAEPCLFDVRVVPADPAHAQRVYGSFRKLSPDVGPFLRRVFLTCLLDKEMAIYRFVARLYREGASYLTRLSDDDYQPLLRVPGVGVVSAKRILVARRTGPLRAADLRKLGVVMKRAQYFLTCSGRLATPLRLSYAGVMANLMAVERAALPAGRARHPTSSESCMRRTNAAHSRRVLTA